MDSFKSKYPSFASLFAIVGSLAQNAVNTSGSLLAKLESELVLTPQVLAFITNGQAAALATEYSALKSDVTGIEGGVELLITDFAFSSDKAKSLIPAIFGVAEWAVAGVAPIQGLAAALKA